MPDTKSTFTLSQLRKKHPKFTYLSYSWQVDGGSLIANFEFLIEPGISFRPSITIDSVTDSKIQTLSRQVINNQIFNLGLVEMISYWKVACSPLIEIQAGRLSREQRLWWKDLMIDGLGEFFFVNNIDFREEEFIQIECLNSTKTGEQQRSLDNKQKTIDTLVLTSGGKDTALTLSLLHAEAIAFGSILLNPTKASLDLASINEAVESIIVRREIDPKLLELNSNGYLNGHTPFSAYLAFLSVLVATIFDYKNVLVSNERSSNEGNVTFLGKEINHQFSKTSNFEKNFELYSKKYLSNKINYFSFLRPLYEIQIAAMLTNFKSVLYRFKSCNRNYKTNSKCGSCPKCLAVYIMIFPFLNKGEIDTIFANAPFSNPSNIPILNDLLGFGVHKPFECVGTYEETILGLFLGLRKAREDYDELPALWLYVQNQGILENIDNLEGKARDVLTSWYESHRVPQPYEGILRKSFERYLKNRYGVS